MSNKGWPDLASIIPKRYKRDNYKDGYKDGLLRAAEIAGRMAKQYIDQYPRPERDPLVYEQGIGMEKVQQAILKEVEGE